MKSSSPILLFLGLCLLSCHTAVEKTGSSADADFTSFESRFLDQYWKQYPSNAIEVGYGKYYENLVIPDSAAFTADLAFSENWLDSLSTLDSTRLSDNNKISYQIIKNQLESDRWYTAVLKPQQWDAATYNLSGDCYYIIHQPYAGLEERLRTLSRRLAHADLYYQAGWQTLTRPTRESIDLSILQNNGGLSIFGKDLSDSIQSSRLSSAEADTLKQRAAKTTVAMKSFVDSLKSRLADKNYVFRKFSIGPELYREKFKYDLVTNFTPEELYARAIEEKNTVSRRMAETADGLWKKYFPNKPKPASQTELIQSVVDAISLQHAKPEAFYSTLKNQVYALKKFIVEKDLFAFDTTYPIVVRLMPEYERGFAIASAEFTPPYQKKGDTYYNIDDITRYPKAKQESTLREMNQYMSQLISIHEAVPGHCLQGIYNNLKSPDVLRSVFTNGAMVEGWAVYTETMMLEAGWDNHSPEMQLTRDKLGLRELGNVIIDYRMQCLDSPKDAMIQFMVKELFQTPSQAEEKYHRATVSQVQLCSYYAGYSAIMALRSAYQVKKGNQYSLKDFHENFLKYGSSPVKFIRERMLQ